MMCLIFDFMAMVNESLEVGIEMFQKVYQNLSERFPPPSYILLSQ